jgi:hypothetical protein
MGRLSFAFEAADEARAAALADAPWFSAALGDYLPSKATGLLQQNIAPRIRPATKEETSVYQDFAKRVRGYDRMLSVRAGFVVALATCGNSSRRSCKPASRP